MEKIKTFFKVVLVIVFLMQTTQAQETAKGIKDAAIKTHQHKNGCCQYKVIYLGGGFNNPLVNSSQKLFGNYSGKTVGFTIDYSQTIIRKSGFSIGFNLGGNYFTGNGNPFGSDLPEPYLVTAQISSEVSGTSNTKNSGYFFGVGPQLNIHFANRFVFSPIFQVGYLGVTQSNFKATQTVLMQGFALPNYTRTYDLISQTETKTSGLGIIPKARLSYMISKNIGIWAEASYLLGPTVNSEITTFEPNTQPNSPPPSSYSIGQMDDGTYTRVTNESKYNSIGFGFGLVYSFGKPSSKNPTTNSISKKPLEITKSTKNNCITYKSPKINSPKQGNEIVTNRNEIYIDFQRSDALYVNYKVQIWRDKKGKKEIVYEQIYPHSFSGNIKDLKLTKDKTENLSMQIQALPAETKDYKGINKRKAAYQKAHCTQFQNDGLSDVVNFTMKSNGCSPDYDMVITKAECAEGGKIKVTGNYVFTLPATATGNQNTVSLANFNVLVDGQALNIHNPSNNINTITNITVVSGQTNNFSFEIDGDAYCEKNLEIRYDVSYVIKCGSQIITNSIPCYAEYSNLPCCLCSYCEKPETSIIIDGLNTATTNITTNNLEITQNFEVNPKVISKVTAEIVSMEEFEVSDECKTCRKSIHSDNVLVENEVYHFIDNNLLTTSNSINKPATSANSTNTFPTKLLEWKTNSIGTFTFDFMIALPGTANLSCCERHGTVCIRYTFTDADCKTCDKYICYQY